MSKLFSLICVMALCLQLNAQQTPLATIPFYSQGAHTFIKLKVNNGSSDHTFLFDTGAGSSVASDKFAAAENFKKAERDTVLESAGGVNTVPISLGNSVALGDQQVGGINFFIEDLSHIQFQGAPVAGVIGYEILRSYVTLIDYEKNLLEFYDPASYRYKNDGAIPFRLIEEIPAIELSYTTPKGKKGKGWFYFDTGGTFSFSFNSSYARKYQLLDEFDKKATVPAMGGSAGKDFYSYQVSMPEVTLSNFSFRDVPTSITTSEEGVSASELVDGAIGNALIYRFNVVMDYLRSEIRLIPNKNYGAGFNFNLTGLSFKMVNDNMVVSNVLEGSPGYYAGFRKDDIINSVNGTAYTNVGELRKLINEKGKVYTFSILREGKAMNVKLKPGRFY